MAKFYKVPASIEKETEKAILDENLGWLPKSKVEVENGWITLPAWLLKSKGISPYMIKSILAVTK